MVWCLATRKDGEVMEYGIPMTEPFLCIERDRVRLMEELDFVSIEIVGIDYNWE